jgi:competence ComEA-like helix-hairpin-helix protein
MRMLSIVGVVALLVLAGPLLAADTLDLNHATQDQLVALGLTPSQAVQIINYRKENGDFLQVEELLAVPQLSHEAFERIRAKVTVGE